MFPFRKERQPLLDTILRFAVGSVFLWFGLDKWLHPQVWFDWIDVWIWPQIMLDPSSVMYLAGAFEAALGVLLIMGRLPRLASAAAALYLFLIFLISGTSDVTVRDAAIMGCCLAVFQLANQRAARPVAHKWVRYASVIYFIYLFAVGVFYLSHPSF